MKDQRVGYKRTPLAHINPVAAFWIFPSSWFSLNNLGFYVNEVQVLLCLRILNDLGFYVSLELLMLDTLGELCYSQCLHGLVGV